MAERGIVGVEGFMGFRVTVMVEADVEASALSVDLGFGRCGWGGCGRRGSVYYMNALVDKQIYGDLIERTAPCAGYCRASAMWSEESFTGRASRALRNDLQNANSDMVGYNRVY